LATYAASSRLALYEELAQSNVRAGHWINERDAMTATKVTHFASDGGEISGLNFNDVVATQNATPSKLISRGPDSI